MDCQPQLVGPPVLEQRLRQQAVAEDRQVLPVLLLELGHLGDRVVPDDGRVVPIGLLQRGAEDVLANAVIRSAKLSSWPGQIAAKSS